MKTCKACGTEYHYCSSCGDIDYAFLGYCTSRCMLESEEFTSAIVNVKKFVQSLSEPQLDMFSKLLKDDYKFENYIEGAIIESYKSRGDNAKYEGII